MPTNSISPAMTTIFNATIELANLNGKNGFTLNGIAAGDFSGASVASAGDINGDGVVDLVIGAPYADPSGRGDAGQSYVMFGKRSAWTSPLELSSLNGINGFIINGIAVGDWSGLSVASAGDINGDGVVDLVIGAPYADPSGRTMSGQSYIVFGKRTPWASPLELSSLNGANGLIINGIAGGGQSGISVASAGDINGDGVADLVIGARLANSGNRAEAGQSYVVFGKRTAWVSPLELSSLNGTNGFIINGIAVGDWSGYSVALARDINGDGVDDLVIGPYQADPSGRSWAGQSYVVFGQRTAWVSPLELSSLNGTNGFIVNGIAADDWSGYSVASVGDMNGDGMADLVIGAPYANPDGRSNAGQSYVVFGKRTTWASPLELSSLNGTHGFIVNGIATGDHSGNSVASAGDINADGVADLVIGAYGANSNGRNDAGQSYVVFGKRTTWVSPLELSSLNGTNGFMINGIAAYDYSGYSVASARDINGDGVADLAIGAIGAGPSGRTQAGQSYVLLGDITIPLINNQLTIAAGQIATLNSTSLFAFTGNYTGEVYFTASNVQNGYFQLLNNPGIAVTQFTQTQLNNGLVQFVSNSSLTPAYSIVASTGIGSAIPPAAQAAQISFALPTISTRFNATLELSTLNGKNGFTLNGIAAGDNSGFSIASAGDINGDGVADLVIGARSADPSGRSLAGQSYVVFGKCTAWTSSLELSSLNGTNGFIINGIVVNDHSGWSVASAGDINSDGVTDLVIGAYLASPGGRSSAGQSYVVFGRRTGWVTPLELSSLSGSNGFIINGIAATDNSGLSVASAGDINGDGVADIVIGAWGASPGGRGRAGQSYVVFGRRVGWSTSLELSSLNGVNGFIVNGIAVSDYSGCSAAPAEDINGDGIADLLIGAPYASPGGRGGAGQSYVVFGKRTGWANPLELSSLNGVNGFILNGIATGDQSGWSVASAGDINNDGVTDLVIGAYLADSNGLSNAGQSYVVFGKRTGWVSPLELSSLNGTNGFIVNGIAADDRSGQSVASAGDINSDGVTDLVIGARYADSNGFTSAGQSYVVFGKRTGWVSPLGLSSLNGTNGFVVNGIAANDNSGVSVAYAGDINGDGLDDIIIGALNADPAGRTSAGQSYVMFGDIMIPIINNQLTIAAGQSATLNSNALFVYAINYTDEIYFKVSNIQNGYFQLSNNPSVSVTQFTQTQLNNGLVQFVSNSSAAPSYSVSASTGIGNAIPSAPQAAQISFTAPSTTMMPITLTNTSVPVPTTVQVTVTSSPVPTTITTVSTPQGAITVTSTAFNTTVTTTSNSVIFTNSTALGSTSTPATASNTTPAPTISSATPQSINTTIPTSSGVITITSTTSGQVTVTVPPTMTITSTPSIVATTTANSLTSSSQVSSPTSSVSSTSMMISNFSNATTFNATLAPTTAVTTPSSALVNPTGTQSNSGSSVSLIASVAGAAAGITAAGAAFFLYSRRKQAQNRIQLAQQQKDKTEIFDIANPIHPTFKTSEDPNSLLAESSTDGWPAHYNQGNSKWGDQYYTHHSSVAQKQIIYDLAQGDSYASESQQPLNIKSNTKDWPAHYHTQNTPWGPGYDTHQPSALKQQAVYDIANTEYVVPGGDSDTPYDLANSYDDISAAYSNQNQNAFFKAADKPAAWDPALYKLQNSAWDKTQYQL